MERSDKAPVKSMARTGKPLTPSGRGIIDPGRAGSRPSNGDNGRSNNSSSTKTRASSSTRNNSNQSNTRTSSSAKDSVNGRWWDSYPRRKDEALRIAAGLHQLADVIHPGPQEMEAYRSRAARQGVGESRNGTRKAAGSRKIATRKTTGSR
jgi:hypothetical protein